MGKAAEFYVRKLFQYDGDLKTRLVQYSFGKSVFYCLDTGLWGISSGLKVSIEDQ